MLCVLRTALHALFKLKDKYLLPNCLAVISNIGPYIANINSYTAERLVTVVQKLGKRIIETEEKHLVFIKMVEKRMSHEGNLEQPSIAGDVDREWAAEMSRRDGVYVDIMLGMQETLRALLTLFCRALRPSAQITNIHLVYAMVRGGEGFCDIVEHPFIVDVYHSVSVDSSGLVHMTENNEVEGEGEQPHGTLSSAVHGALHKIGDILSAAAHTHSKSSSSALPPVYANTPLLPLGYLPLLIRRGIRWMRRIKFLSFNALTVPAVETSSSGSSVITEKSSAVPDATGHNKQSKNADGPAGASDETDGKDPDDMDHKTAQEVEIIVFYC